MTFHNRYGITLAAALRTTKVYNDDGKFGGTFGLDEPNTANAKYFIGNSYLRPLTNPKQTVIMANVTFEPKRRNNRHIHKSEKGGGQILLRAERVRLASGME